MSNGLLNINTVDYDYISANSASITDLEVNSISPLTGNNISVNGNLIISNGYSFIGNTTGVHTGEVTGNVIGNLEGSVKGNLEGNVTGNVTGSASYATSANYANQATQFLGALSGDVIGYQSVTQIANGVITNANINASAAIQDTKLATITTANKVANSATTATPLSTANAICARDSNGDFNARRALVNSVALGNVGYGSLNMSGGNTNGGLYPAYSTLGDGVHFGYNYTSYGSADGQTPSVLTPGGGCSRISAGYGSVVIAVSNAGVPCNSTQNRLMITPGNISAINGTTFTCNSPGVGTGQYALNSTGGVARWLLGTANAESSSNAGSDFVLWRYADNGSFLGEGFRITRSDGAFTTNSVNAGNINSTGTITAGGAISGPSINVTSTVTTNSVNTSTVTASGAVSGASFNTIGAVTAGTINVGTVTASGAISGLSLSATNSITATSLTVNGGVKAIQQLSGALTSPVSLGVGRTVADVELAVAAGSGQFATGAISGDAVIRNNNASNSILLAIGSTPYATISTSGMNATNFYTNGSVSTPAVFTSVGSTYGLIAPVNTRLVAQALNIASSSSATLFTFTSPANAVIVGGVIELIFDNGSDQGTALFSFNMWRNGINGAGGSGVCRLNQIGTTYFALSGSTTSSTLGSLSAGAVTSGSSVNVFTFSFATSSSTNPINYMATASINTRYSPGGNIQLVARAN